ncbi:ArsB/NhaD family transporter [Candidatus Woesearchaeota archaeon]|nr:ArsB/NhaD family transporter [Candidatus Woesearchaeota archaeon]
MNKAVAALIGVSFLLITQITTEHEISQYVELETIMLLFGMMIIVTILRHSGLFNYLALTIANLTKGSPIRILVLFSIVTAVLSAFLDNVTTVLIIIPIILELTKGMGLNPVPYIISQAIISNIGGTATLIGDPPNIIIGSSTGLTFNQFIINLSIPVTIIFIASLLYLWLTNRNFFKSIDSDLVKIFSVQMLLSKLRHRFLRQGMKPRLFNYGMAVLVLTLILFILQGVTGISPGIVALTASMILLALTRSQVEKIMEEVEWTTLIFFAGLFILVGILEEEGIIAWIAENIFLRLGDNPYFLVLVIIWVSGILSGFLDNIPFTITMIPIIEIILQSNPIPGNILWWALALGACLGGNLTLIGASANIVSVGIAKRHGIHISFLEFMKVGFPITIISLLISSVYLCTYLWVIL